MDSKVLVILEVSQKQAYIFSSNKLKENVIGSGEIEYVTSTEFFEKAAPGKYTKEQNMVYSGGGHTILQFDTKDKADAFIAIVTRKVMEDYPGMELFAKQYSTKGEPTAEDMKKLVDLLEEKKSFRKASFRHGSFGVEEISTNTREPKRAVSKERKMPETSEKRDRELFLPVILDQRDPKYPISQSEYQRAYSFEDLSAAEGDKNFIAIVHIDGNAMGKRVEQFRKSKLMGRPWEEIRKNQYSFSKNIDDDFSGAYRDMCEEVACWLNAETEEKALGLKVGEDGRKFFPIRRIISAGDDMCFVTEGSIGIECARIFMEKLAGRENDTDHMKYSACAGVAIVHRKYPFYRAYEMSEMLCSNAKKYIVTAMGEEASAEVSAIDWHIELGELQDTLDDIRRGYLAEDGTHMELRPYIVVSPDHYRSSARFPSSKMYGSFRNVISGLQGSDSAARGKYKALREEIGKGKTAAENFMRLNLLQDSLKELLKESSASGEPYVTIERTGHIGNEKIEYSTVFDAIEAMDVWRKISIG